MSTEQNCAAVNDQQRELRLAVLASHPIQYQAPLYRELARRLALKVFFCWDFGVKDTYDPQFGREIKWDIPLTEGYEHEFLPNRSRAPGTHHMFGLHNPGVVARLDAWHPDVIVVHGYTHWTSLVVMAASLGAGTPILLRGESNLLRPRPRWVQTVKAVALRSLFHRLDGALAIGTENRRYYEYYGLPSSRIFMAPYSVDNEYFRSRREVARAAAHIRRAQLGISLERKVVVFAAKLIEKKGCEILIRALATDERLRSTFELVIVGDGALSGSLRELATTQNVRAHFLGFMNQSEMPIAYSLGDIYVLPSLVEPWGLAVNEAMNLEVPVIVSDSVGAQADLVSPETGWVFETGSVSDLARCLTEAAKRDLPAMGKSAGERVKEWSVEATADGYVHGARVVRK